MLGDKAYFLSEMVSTNLIKRAFSYAIYDREHTDFFFDPFELDFVKQNQDEICHSIAKELQDLDEYAVKPAFSYFPQKNSLCYRRMIYLPFKDLVARYCFVSLLADLTDADLYSRSFANRLSSVPSSKFLLEPYATVSCPRFCDWQEKCSSNHSVLLKTDISAFYDSISHASMIHSIAETLAIPANSKLMIWFSRLLKPEIFSLSKCQEIVGVTEDLRQGLCIGNSVDGYLANIYLRETDARMEEYCSKNKLDYGRYNDDIRIFANSRNQAKEAILFLQQHLLRKGLNLNAAKTQFAQSESAMKELISKSYFYHDYEDEEELETEEAAIDKPLDYDDGFSITDNVDSETAAKKYCRCMQKKLRRRDRRPTQMKTLYDITVKFPSSARHACWLLVETSVNPSCAYRTKTAATKYLLKILEDEETSFYVKYRILHHLSKERQDSRRYIELLSPQLAKSIRELCQGKFLSTAGMELTIGALYINFLYGDSLLALRRLLISNCVKPLPLQFQNTLLRLAPRPKALTITALDDQQKASKRKRKEKVRS